MKSRKDSGKQSRGSDVLLFPELEMKERKRERERQTIAFEWQGSYCGLSYDVAPTLVRSTVQAVVIF